MNISSGQSEKIGEKLRKQRLQLGISLPTLSKKTRIKEEYLLGIEESNFDIFSSYAHALGFVRNFGKAVNINPDYAVKIFKREYAKRGSTAHNTTYSVTKSVRKPFFILVFVVIWGGIIIAIVGTLIRSHKPLLEITSPVVVNATEHDKYTLDWSEDHISIRGNIDAGNTLKFNNNDVETYGIGYFEISNIKLVEENNLVTILTRNQFGVQEQIEIQIFVNLGE